MFLSKTLPYFLLGIILLFPSWLDAPALDKTATNPAYHLQTAQNKNAVSSKSLASALQLALSRRQLDRARELLSQLLRLSNVDSDTLLKTGIQLAQLELYAEASLVFTRCARDYPTVFEGHYNLALAYLALQRYPEAQSALQQSPQGSKPQELARLYLRGKIQEAEGKKVEAERDLSAAFAGAPQQENYALDLGLFYLRHREYPKAVEVFERGERLHSQSTFLMLGLSLAQFLAGHPTQAIESCRKLLNSNPVFSPIRLLLAFALYQGGELDESERVAAAGLSKEHPHPYLYYLHAAVLQKLQSKDSERMLRELATARQGIPDCALCYLVQGKVHQSLGDLQSAIDDLERAVKIDPAFSEAWYHLSLVYERAGRHADATQASAQFSKLKAEKTNNETELLRKLFLETLGN